MPNLLSGSKEVEFEWNLALQIRNQKERWSRRRAEKEVEQWGAKFSPAFFTFWYFFTPFFLFCPPCLMSFEGILVFYPICSSI